MKYKEVQSWVTGLDMYEVDFDSQLLTDQVESVEGVTKAVPTMVPKKFIVIIDNSRSAQDILTDLKHV